MLRKDWQCNVDCGTDFPVNASLDSEGAIERCDALAHALQPKTAGLAELLSGDPDSIVANGQHQTMRNLPDADVYFGSTCMLADIIERLLNDAVQRCRNLLRYPRHMVGKIQLDSDLMSQAAIFGQLRYRREESVFDDRRWR